MFGTRFLRVFLAAPILFATPGCTASLHGTMEGEGPRASSLAIAALGSNVISGTELRAATGMNAFEIVQRQRPAFLRNRSPLHAPAVFLNDMRLGGLETLREIPAASITEIRYLDATAATWRFGSGNSGGVIHVLTFPIRR